MTARGARLFAQLQADRERLNGIMQYGTEHRRPAETGPLHRHAGLSIARLVSTCWPCAERKIRWLAEQPEFSHQGRNGRRLAAIHNVSYTPYEARSDGGKERVGQRELEARNRRST